MKKSAWTTVVVGLTLVFMGSALSEAETITLTLTDQHSEYSWGSVHALQPWVKQVERASKGQVKIQIYPNQTLSMGEDNWNAVKNGFADIGWCSHRYWPGMTPCSGNFMRCSQSYRGNSKRIMCSSFIRAIQRH